MLSHNNGLLAQVEFQPILFTRNNKTSAYHKTSGIPLIRTKNGTIVNGIKNGIILHNLDGTEQFIANMPPGDTFSTTWSLREAKNGIWIGTDRELAFYNYQTNALEKVQPKYALSKNWQGFKEIYDIRNKSEEELWLCTATGLYTLDIKKNEITNHWHRGSPTQFLPFDIVYHQYEDNDGIRWLATNNGLIKWGNQLNNYTVYNQQAGFSNNTVYAVYEDGFNHLWMSSDYGIIRFHKKTEMVSSFITKHGISHNEFNRASHFQDSDGTIYFGGLDGITSFQPKDFQQSKPTMSQLLLSDFSVYNGNLGQIESKTGLTRQNKEIDILPHYRYLNLKFAMPTYEDDYLNKYAWKIDHVDSNWQIQSENKLQLGVLPYGSHLLQIKGSNSGGGWASEHLKIQLNVLKPFYLQNWFIALVSFLFLLAILGYTQYKTRRLRANEVELQAKVAQATETIQKDKELIQQQAADLQEMDAVKSRFFTNVSHELRTPLTLILGPLEQLLNKSDKPLPKHIESKLALSLTNSKKLKSRVDELLDLSKLDGKELKLNLAPADISAVVHNTIESFRPITEAQGIKLEAHGIKRNEGHLLIDEERFVKVLDNLLSNALKHSLKNSKITVHLQLGKENHSIRVSDQGSGVNEAEKDEIFKRFYQTSEGTAVGGTGIGLSLSKNIAELMGGSLKLDTAYTDGASFVFEFCATQTKASVEKVESSDKQGAQTNTPNLLTDKKLNLLLVEDNLELRTYVRSIVEDNYIIHECGDGLAALSLLDTQKIDIIISDIMMPNMDGITMVQELKKQNKNTPIIMLSAKSNQEDIVALLELGVDDYIVKPFYARELLARLNNQAKNLAGRKQAALQNENETVLSYSEKWNQELRNFIFENISNSNFGVPDVVSHMNTSERTLNRRLNKEVGISCGAYIKEIRLQKALQHLQTKTFNSIKELSHSWF